MNEAVHSEILVLVWRRARTSIECLQENEYVPLKVCVPVWRARESRVSQSARAEGSSAEERAEVFPVMLENI